MKPVLIALALAMSLCSGTTLAQDKPAFVFTAIPDQDETGLVDDSPGSPTISRASSA